MKPSIPAADPAMLALLRARADAAGVLSFADFMDAALYAPGIGYYRRDRVRVGFAEGADFLTATTSSPVFARLVVAACSGLLAGQALSGFDFVEIGPEPGAGILREAAHPFRSVRQLRLDDELKIDGPCVVFSNELFDAQPFRRFRGRQGRWRELGVRVSRNDLSEVELDSQAPPAFPQPAPEGYVIDAPIAAAGLAATIASQPWSGLFLAFDYGKSWPELAVHTPQGTARSYRRHVQGGDLLAAPGDQDLTCHVCWDWIAQALEKAGFEKPSVESQEGFFIRHAGEAIAALAASEAGRLSRDKLSLMQLLHPAHMGQKFQALWALRR